VLLLQQSLLLDTPASYHARVCHFAACCSLLGSAPAHVHVAAEHHDGKGTSCFQVT
jgi:hypothetical protein